MFDNDVTSMVISIRELLVELFVPPLELWSALSSFFFFFPKSPPMPLVMAPPALEGESDYLSLCAAWPVPVPPTLTYCSNGIPSRRAALLRNSTMAGVI